MEMRSSETMELVHLPACGTLVLAFGGSILCSPSSLAANANDLKVN
jgi:hypothetical protein